MLKDLDRITISLEKVITIIYRLKLILTRIINQKSTVLLVVVLVSTRWKLVIITNLKISGKIKGASLDHEEWENK